MIARLRAWADREAGVAGRTGGGDVLRAEERRGLLFAYLCRSAVYLPVGLLCVVVYPGSSLHFQIAIAFGLVTGGLMVLCDRLDWHGAVFVLVAAEMAANAYTNIGPNLSYLYPVPPQMQHSFEGRFPFSLLLLCALAFSHRPALIAWGGTCYAVFVGLGIRALEGLPTTIVGRPLSEPHKWDYWVHFNLPTYVKTIDGFTHVSLVLVLTALLTMVVVRSRRLAHLRAREAAERAALERYFPPETIETFQRRGAAGALGAPATAEIAILFVDVVGFTGWAEGREPHEVLGEVRRLQNLGTAVVYEHDGSVTKFLGDGLMATFGLVRPEGAAANAIACAMAIADGARRAEREATERGDDFFRIAVGVHFGQAVVGDVGSESRLELAVMGDAVNIASRLEAAARSLDVDVVVSEACAARAEAERAGSAAALEPRGPVEIRGRAGRIETLAYAGRPR